MLLLSFFFFICFKLLVYKFPNLFREHRLVRGKDAPGRCSRNSHLDFFEITLWS